MKRAIIRGGVAAFVATLTLPAAPLEAEAQHPAGKVRHIGLLHPGTPPNPNVEAFRQGLRDLGYVEGQNIEGSRNAAFRRGSGPPEKVFNELWKPYRGRLGARRGCKVLDDHKAVDLSLQVGV